MRYGRRCRSGGRRNGSIPLEQQAGEGRRKIVLGAHLEPLLKMGLTNTARDADGFASFAAAVDASVFVKGSDRERIQVGRSDDGLWWYRIVSRAEVDEQAPALPTDTAAAQTGELASGDRAVNFILQGKGGVGESLIAALLAAQLTTGAGADAGTERISDPASSSDGE